MYTLTQIKQMGFTDSIIKTLNIIPTEIKPNPRNKKYPIKLFLKSYIDELVVSEQFLTLHNANINRRLGALKSTNTKVEKLMRDIDNLNIRIKIVENVEVLALRQYNEYNITQLRLVNVKDDVRFLDRLCVNYIRHELTNYDNSLDFTVGKVGKYKAFNRINEKIYTKIKEVYPQYRDECDRQLKIKIGDELEWWVLNGGFVKS